MTTAPAARIVMYFHCKTCIGIEKKEGKRVPVDHGEKLAVGWTKEGIQVVCENCGKSVADIDLKGQKVSFYHEIQDKL